LEFLLPDHHTSDIGDSEEAPQKKQMQMQRRKAELS
jgi:hypothetical protein